MKRWFVLGAAALLIGSIVVDDVSAQRRGMGGGVGAMRMSGFSGGSGVRMAGPGFRSNMGTVGIGGPGIRGVRTAGVGVRTAVPGTAWAGTRHAGWDGWRGRRFWGWGLPFAAGVGLGYYGSSYYDDCLQWDGYQWVNVCYSYPYAYSSYPY